MKLTAALVLLCSTVSAVAVCAANAPQPNSVYYELKLKSESYGNMGVRKMWIKGSNVRWESKSAHLPLALIKNKEGVFIVHPWKKIAAKYPEGSDRGNPRALFSGPTGSVKAFLKYVNAKKHGTETVSGQSCDLYSYNDPLTKRPTKFWVGVKSGKPVQLLLKGQTGKIDTVIATYTKYELGAKVPDTLFQLPKGCAVRPMPKMELTSKAPRKATAKKSG